MYGPFHILGVLLLFVIIVLVSKMCVCLLVFYWVWFRSGFHSFALTTSWKTNCAKNHMIIPDFHKRLKQCLAVTTVAKFFYSKMFRLLKTHFFTTWNCKKRIQPQELFSMEVFFHSAFHIIQTRVLNSFLSGNSKTQDAKTKNAVTEAKREPRL